MNHHYIVFFKTDLFASITEIAEWFEFQMTLDMSALYI